MGRVDRIGQQRATHVHRCSGLGRASPFAFNGADPSAAGSALACPTPMPCLPSAAAGRMFARLRARRFVVERTIEENVHRLCQQRAAAMDLSAASGEYGSSS